jgi:autotransporter-associated beta strand protein
LIKVGAGTLTLSGTNTYTGTTTLSAGTLALSGGSAIANTGAVILDTTSANLTLSANETIGSLAGVSGTTVSLGSNTLTAGDANDTAFAGAMGGTGGLTKVGLGALTLSGTNTYTGTTTVSAGKLALSGGSAIANTGAVNLDTTGANLTLSANETVGSLAGVAGTTVTLDSNTLTAGDANNTAFAGAMGGTGGLTKVGVGTLTLSGTNTYTGGTSVTAGNLTAGVVTNAFGASSSAISVNGGSLNLDSFDQTVGAVTIGDWIYVAGGGAVLGGGVQSAVHEAFSLSQ